MAQSLICPNCGYKGNPKKVTKGNFLIEVILWLCFLIPGVVYSIWRLSTKFMACSQCNATNLVSLDSPRGKKLETELA